MNKTIKFGAKTLFPHNWTVDDACARKRNIPSCLNCVRFELGICPQAVKAYKEAIK